MSNTTLSGCGYMNRYVLLDNWINLTDNLSVYSLFPTHDLIQVKVWEFDDSEPTCSGVNHHNLCETKIILDDSIYCILLYYRLAIWTYQVYMHQIPRFQFCNIIRWKMSINSLYFSELLTYLAQISKQLCLCDKAFQITYLYDCFCKSTTTRLVEI